MKRRLGATKSGMAGETGTGGEKAGVDHSSLPWESRANSWLLVRKISWRMPLKSTIWGEE